jgi:membrane protein YdbS with pleckstrin-like domain
VPSGGQPTVYLPQGESLIGRAPGASLRITDRAISDRHASILVSDLRASIRDLGSTNGTYVNQTVIPGDTYTILHSGDVITVGREKLRYELLASTTAAPHPSSQPASPNMANALSYLAACRYAEAEGLLRTEIDQRGATKAAVLALAQAQYGQGKYDEAARTIWPLLQVTPDDFGALSLYGMALKGKGLYSESADVLSRALRIQDSPGLRQALDEIAGRRSQQTAASAPPFNAAGAGGGAGGAGGSLAEDLDSPGQPGATQPADGMKGSLIHQWHRNVLSFKSFWLGVLVLAGTLVAAARAGQSGSLVLSAGIILAAVLVIASFLRAAFTRYSVYDRRIDFAAGVLFQRRNPVWLYDITDISMRRSPLLILTGTAAIDIVYDTKKQKAGSESIVAAASSSKMRDFLERLQQDWLRERRAMKKIWI